MLDLEAIFSDRPVSNTLRAAPPPTPAPPELEYDTTDAVPLELEEAAAEASLGILNCQSQNGPAPAADRLTLYVGKQSGDRAWSRWALDPRFWELN